MLVSVIMRKTFKGVKRLPSHHPSVVSVYATGGVQHVIWRASESIEIHFEMRHHYSKAVSF
jgi:hypothetical protein